MPLSGSYFFPVVQAPNSSFPSIDLRELGVAQSSAGNLGRLFVSASNGTNSVFYVDELGTITDLTNVLNFTGSVVVSGNLDVLGDFFVFGDTIILSASNLAVEDPLIVLAISQSGSPTFDAGFVVERGTSENVALIWDESLDRFAFINTDETGTTAGNVTINDYADLAAANFLLVSSSVTAVNDHLVLSSSAGSLVQISGALVVRQNLSAQGSVNFAQVTRHADNAPLQFGAGGDISISFATNQTPDNLLFGVGVGGGKAMVFVETADIGFDFAHPAQINPTIFVHSTNQSTTEWTSITHDQTDGLIAVGAGSLALNPIDDVIISGSNTTVVANDQHLILSSSAGSQVTVSGTLNVTEELIVSGNLVVNGNIIVSASNAGTSVGTTGVVVDTFGTSDFRTVKYIVSVSSGSSFQAEEILLLQDATTVVINEFSILSLPGSVFIGFEASITGSIVNLIASGSALENTVKLIRTTLTV